MLGKLARWLKWALSRVWANLIGFLAILWPAAMPRAKKALVTLIGGWGVVLAAKYNVTIAPDGEWYSFVNEAIEPVLATLTAFLAYRVPNSTKPSDSPVVKVMEMR